MRPVILFILIVLLSACFLTSCSAVVSKVAVISLNGVIQIESGSSVFSGSAITPDDVRKQLERAQNDFSVKAIVIQVNSPGGDVSACQEIVYAMQKVKKPVVISMRSVAASGGYYISAKANKIIALPSTLTGSIGVISEIPNLKGLFDKIGVNMEIVKSGKYKDMYSGMSELTPDERAIIQKTNDELYGEFINIVAEGRHMDPDKVKELATGQAYTGLQAKELGLVDELGGLQTAVDEAAKLASIENPQVEYYHPQSAGLFAMLFGGNNSTLTDFIGGKLLGAEQVAAMSFINNSFPRFLYQ
ncbi:MAG: signal peptide peptidase SppA [Dehalococcoidia bacterium]|jgi:protease IV